MKVRKAVFPAAGLGTRFLPATKAQRKEMLPLVDKPIIQYVIEEAVAAGLTNIIIVTGRGKNAIEDHFDVSYELEKLLQERGKTELLEQVRRCRDIVHEDQRPTPYELVIGTRYERPSMLFTDHRRSGARPVEVVVPERIAAAASDDEKRSVFDGGRRSRRATIGETA